MQTEKAKSSHFDRTRGDKNQIFPTQDIPIYSPETTNHDATKGEITKTDDSLRQLLEHMTDLSEKIKKLPRY